MFILLVFELKNGYLTSVLRISVVTHHLIKCQLEASFTPLLVRKPAQLGKQSLSLLQPVIEDFSTWTEVIQPTVEAEPYKSR